MDARAVIESLREGEGLSYVGMDVYEEEGPLFFADRSLTIIQDDVFERLTTLPNVVVTGHQGFLTHEALRQISKTTLSNINEFESGQERLANAVKLNN